MFRFAFGKLRGLWEARSGAAPAPAPVRSGRCGRPARGAWAYPGRGVVAGGGHEGTPEGALLKTPGQKCCVEFLAAREVRRGAVWTALRAVSGFHT